MISAGGDRRSRFHTEANVFIGWKQVVSETPFVAAQKLSSQIVGSRGVAPWWPLPAIAEVERRLAPHMAAVEFGSGSSTLWIARRVQSLLSREHNADWAKVTQKRLQAEGLTNAVVQHRDGADYFALDAGQSFDFAVVDGEFRWKCLEAISDKISPGGLIYLDNSDSDKDAKHYAEYDLTGDHYAQAALRQIAERYGADVEEFHGMIHGELFAGSGMMVSFP